MDEEKNENADKQASSPPADEKHVRLGGIFEGQLFEAIENSLNEPIMSFYDKLSASLDRIIETNEIKNSNENKELRQAMLDVLRDIACSINTANALFGDIAHNLLEILNRP